MKTKIIVALLICYSTLVLNAQASGSNINVVINGKNVGFNSNSGYPYIDENYRTMVPLRITMEATGAAVGYDSAAQTAIVVTEHDRIEVPIGEDYPYNNGNKIQNDTKAVASNGRTYLPIRAVLESAGYTVEWDAGTNSVIAYNFNYSSTDLVPYSTSDLETLLDGVLSGDVVYIDGQYYATPSYVKQIATPQIHYIGDDLNTAIYPQGDGFTVLTPELSLTVTPDEPTVENPVPEYVYVEKEWLTKSDLQNADCAFRILVFDGTVYQKGFLKYQMDDLPDDFEENPVSGTYNGIRIKVENGEILFNQEDLISVGLITDPITELQ